jgi:hypothetical protein
MERYNVERDNQRKWDAYFQANPNRGTAYLALRKMHANDEDAVFLGDAIMKAKEESAAAPKLTAEEQSSRYQSLQAQFARFAAADKRPGTDMFDGFPRISRLPSSMFHGHH